MSKPSFTIAKLGVSEPEGYAHEPELWPKTVSEPRARATLYRPHSRNRVGTTTGEVDTPVQSTHDRIDESFRSLGHYIFARPWRVLGLTLLVTAALAAFLPTLWSDFSNDSYLLPGDDARERFNAFRDQFGLDDRTVVALEPDNLFDLEFLAKLRDMHRRIEEIPRVEEVMSLVNARVTRGEQDELVVEELMEVWPESNADLAVLRERVLSNPTYRDILISEDARYTVILVRMATYSSLDALDDALDGFDDVATSSLESGAVAPPEYLTGRENDLVVRALYELASEFESEDLVIRLAGEGVIGQRATELSTEDSGLFSGGYRS